MPALYQTLVFLHVLSALWMAASAFAGTVVRAQARRAPDFPTRATAFRIGARLVAIFGLPGALAAGTTGILLAVVNRAWLGEGWVHLSMTIWAVLVSTNLFWSFPRLRRIVREMDASAAAGAPTAELQRLTASKAAGIVADVNAFAVVVFVFLMTVKPSF